MTKVFLLVFFLLSVATASHMEMMDEDLETEDSYIKIMDEDLETEDSLWNLYERWISHINVSRDPDEKQKRFKAFKDNARDIHQFNKRDDMSCKQGLNIFADTTDEEFAATYVSFDFRRHLPRDLRRRLRRRRDLRDARLGGIFSVDSRQNGAVAAVKDRGQCVLDERCDVGALNNRRLAASYCNVTSGFEESLGLVTRMMQVVQKPQERALDNFIKPLNVLEKFRISDPCSFVEVDIQALV